jgi:hypothetical protein
MTDSYYHNINGPLNVVRLEGMVGSIRKTCYIFFDFHLSPNEQMECVDEPEIDVHRLFRKKSKEKREHKLDFFLEMYPNEFLQPKDKYRRRYIDKVIESLKKTSIANKGKMISHEKNTRIHFMDIREFIFEPMRRYLMSLLSFQRSWGALSESEIKQIVSILKELKKIIGDTLHPLMIGGATKISSIFDASKHEDDRKMKQQYIYEKIIGKYKHKSIHKIISKYISKDLSDYKNELYMKLDELLEDFSQLKSLMNVKSSDLHRIPGTDEINYGLDSDYARYRIVPLLYKLSLLHNELIYFYARVTDTYFLRRFLDKDYVTNGILYSGAAHGCHLVYVLLKYFDFDITHAFYSKIPVNKIKKNIGTTIRNYKEMKMILWPPKLLQCCNLKGFPKDFL